MGTAIVMHGLRLIADFFRRQNPAYMAMQPLHFTFPTDRQMQLLQRAQGGQITRIGSPEHDEFEAMAEIGWVKEVMVSNDSIAWRLSGDGLRYAYRTDLA